MQTTKEIDRIYTNIADSLDINDDLFFAAEDKYKELGAWFDTHLPQYTLEIYPQGSFALGTVVKPLARDEYDLDLVCEFSERYGLSAKDMKCAVVGPALRKFEDPLRISEKKRCWQVRYPSTKHFHMDIVPAYDKQSHIAITDKAGNGEYAYLGSNPKKYILWFQERMKVRYEVLRKAKDMEIRMMMDSAEITEIPRYRIKTPLQRAIQMLKRHRDIMFREDIDGIAPISIIISTVAASLYQNEENVFSAIQNFLQNAPTFVLGNMRNGKYVIANPVFTGQDKENFAEKWNIHPERAQAFFKWIAKAREDLTDARLFNETRLEMADRMKTVFGEVATRAYEYMAVEDSNAIQASRLKVETKTGILSTSGTKTIPTNHHHGKE